MLNKKLDVYLTHHKLKLEVEPVKTTLHAPCNTVECMECGVDMKRITVTHLRKAHDMSFAEYRQKYPDAKLVSDETLTKASVAISKGTNILVDTTPEPEVEKKEKDYGVPEDQLVTCLVCSKKFIEISHKHLKNHDLTITEYYEMYPGAVLRKMPVTRNRRTDEDIEMDNAQPEDDTPQSIPTVQELLKDSDFMKSMEPLIQNEGLKEQTVFNSNYEHEPIDETDERKLLTTKESVFEMISSVFKYVVKDHIIRKAAMGNIVEYEHITDFCIPVRKIIFDFPDAMWHNKETLPDYIRNAHLKRDGWRIIGFRGTDFNLDMFARLKNIKK